MLLRAGSISFCRFATFRAAPLSLMSTTRTASTSRSPLALTEVSTAVVDGVHDATAFIEADAQLTARYKLYRVAARDDYIDWVDKLELQSARQLGASYPVQPRVLILYGSLRKVSYSRCMAYEFARVLDSLGADVRVFDPAELPVKDEDNVGHPKVVELRISVSGPPHMSGFRQSNTGPSRACSRIRSIGSRWSWAASDRRRASVWRLHR